MESVRSRRFWQRTSRSRACSDSEINGIAIFDIPAYNDPARKKPNGAFPDYKKEKKSMKKTLLIVLALLLLFAALTPAALAAEEAEQAASDCTYLAAKRLAALGIFNGTDVGLELERAPTRQEAAAMLVRLYGAEETARASFAAEQIANPFADVSGWAEPYVAWLYANGLARGISAETFGAARSCSAKDYAVFLLRSLGYADGEDFTYADALAAAAERGIYLEGLFSGTFTRGDLALMTWFALFSKCSEGNLTLLQSLVKEGAADADAARTLQSQYQSDGISLSAQGVVFTPSRWRSAEKEWSITVRIAGNAPSLAGNTLTLDAQSLTALTEEKDGKRLLYAERLHALAESWNAAYGVKNGPFLFESYVKGWTEIGFLTCDYQLDTAAAEKALLRQILTLRSGTVDAPLCCYRNGKPFSLGDTYVEVDFDNQQLTFFKHGQMVLNSDVVTGKLDGHQTPVGLYYSHNKQTNCTLVGSDYEVFVKYWISIIYDVIGFHDASWRGGIFGGEEYVNNGSHGCINTPEAAMKYLFDHLEDGTPVLMHGRNTWYDVNDPAASPVTQNPLHGQTAAPESAD